MLLSDCYQPMCFDLQAVQCPVGNYCPALYSNSCALLHAKAARQEEARLLCRCDATCDNEHKRSDKRKYSHPPGFAIYSPSNLFSCRTGGLLPQCPGCFAALKQ